MTKMGCNDPQYFCPSFPHVVDGLCSQRYRTTSGREYIGYINRGEAGDGEGKRVWSWGGARDTERYKGTRYLLELIRVVSGVGVEVLRHG
jgi:hypothetical protein